MAFQPLSCSSCGASDVRREAGRFLCSFCGATVIPRLLPGTLCGERDGSDWARLNAPFQTRPIAKVDDEGGGEEPIYSDLSAHSPRKDWDACSWGVKARLALVERLRSKVRA